MDPGHILRYKVAMQQFQVFRKLLTNTKWISENITLGLLGITAMV